MSYTPTTDFLALLRNTGGGERVLSMPGLDYVVEALARAGLVYVSVGQTAPTANQAFTVWLKPSVPSWTAEAQVYLWNVRVGVYQLATPQLFQQVLVGTVGYVFQSAQAPTNAINVGTSLLAIQRASPVATILTLPPVALQGSKSIQIVDWSTAVANHAITILPQGTNLIMQGVSWELLSSAVQLGSVTLYPSIDLNGWVIAP